MVKNHWKFNYTDLSLIERQTLKKKYNTTISWNSTITAAFIGKTFWVHNGKKVIKIIVVQKMLGHKFGEFSFTRSKFRIKNK